MSKPLRRVVLSEAECAGVRELLNNPQPPTPKLVEYIQQCRREVETWPKMRRAYYLTGTRRGE